MQKRPIVSAEEKIGYLLGVVARWGADFVALFPIPLDIECFTQEVENYC